MIRKILIPIILLIPTEMLIAQDRAQLAVEFINSLSPDLRSRMLFPMDDPEQFNLNFIPIERQGTTFHDFDEKQKKAALALLRSSLSQEGYRKTADIMQLEKILFVLENDKNKFNDGSSWRDPLNYHFWIFGDPSSGDFWGWKFEGHHISLNFLSSENRIVSSTPSFFGSNPAVIDVRGHKRMEVLKLEADLGFQLVNSLSQDQLKQARFSDTAPHEIITGNSRDVENIEPKGIFYSSLDDSQKSLLLKLIHVYVDNYEPGFSDTFWDKIENSGLDNLAFAWAGSLKPGIAHYYRIQGPVLLIEYDNTQNDANHVHSVVRDPTNDYAKDVLKEHYLHDH